MFSGFSALGSWIKAHKWTAAILFLVLIPFVLRGVFVWLSKKEESVPVIGPVLSNLGVTDSLAAQ